MIDKNIPNGATHQDGLSYWKKTDDDKWYMWLESCEQWRKIVAYEAFHSEFPIKSIEVVEND